MREQTMQRAILFILILLTTAALQAQPDAEDAIRRLKNGALIMRLPAYAQKIAALEEIIATNNDQSAVRRSKKLLAKTQKEAREENLRIIRSFRKFYNFSTVYFTYDTSITTLRSGAYQGIFLNDDLSPAPQISLPNGNFLLVHIGYTDPATTQRSEALILTDLSLTQIAAPFPSAIRYNAQSVMLGLNKESTRQKQIKSLNTRLTRFYNGIESRK